MTNSSQESDYIPESQFAKTTSYVVRLLSQHGRAPVQGEVGGKEVESRMRIDPAGDGYGLKDIHITRMTDGSHVVSHIYDTYNFDPRCDGVTRSNFMAPWGEYTVVPRVTRVDDTEQRALIVTISDAMYRGKIVQEEPLFTTAHRLRTLLKRIRGMFS